MGHDTDYLTLVGLVTRARQGGEHIKQLLSMTRHHWGDMHFIWPDVKRYWYSIGY